MWMYECLRDGCEGKGVAVGTMDVALSECFADSGLAKRRKSRAIFLYSYVRGSWKVDAYTLCGSLDRRNEGSKRRVNNLKD